MSAPKPELTTHERAEKMVAERMKQRFCYDPTTFKEQRIILNGNAMEQALWSEAVRLQAALLEKEGE